MEVNLLKYLPSYYKRSTVVNDIIGCQSSELQKFMISLNSMSKQFFVVLADTSLDRWEKELGIKINPNLSLAERRGKIISKLRSQGTVTKEAIKQIAQSFISDVDVVEDNENYRFEIILNSKIGFPYDLDSLYRSIEEVKPVHLESKYKLNSITSFDFFLGAFSMLGEEVTIYPYTPKSIESLGEIDIATSISQSADTTTIYPKGVL